MGDGVIRKMNIFGGMKIMWIFWGGVGRGHHKTGGGGAFLCILVSLGQGTEWIYFLRVAKISNIF